MLRNIVRKTGRSVGLWRQHFRKLGVVAALGLALALLAACGSDAEATPAVEPEAQPTTIVDIAVGDDRFQTLVAALQAADLVETLQGEGPFTVFAPTDDAFAKLPEGTVDALLKDIPALADILLYHVVSGNLMAADVVKLDMQPPRFKGKCSHRLQLMATRCVSTTPKSSSPISKPRMEPSTQLTLCWFRLRTKEQSGHRQ